jgi:hypothetical protein
MSYLVGRLVLIGIITSLPACIVINDFKGYLKAYEDKLETQLPYHHSSSDAKVDWDAVQLGNDTIIDGRVTNVQNMQESDFYVDVDVLDSEGNHVSKGRALLPPESVFWPPWSAFPYPGSALSHPGNLLWFPNSVWPSISSLSPPVIILKRHDSFTFSIKLKDVQITKGDVLKFFINYRIITGAWGGRYRDWIFKVDATTGLPFGKDVQN